MSAYDIYFNDPKYKIRKTKIKLENGDYVYRFHCREIDISDMLFILRDDKTYEPCIYDYKVLENGKRSGKFIKKGTIAYAFIQSIHYTEKTVNQKTKKIENGNLSILQWYFGIKMINSAIKYEKNRWDLEVSRQFGKTHLSARIAGFLPVFAPLYADMPNDRWWQIIASYNDDSVKEIFDLKVKPVIKKNIEFFNKLYPNNPLVYRRHKSETFTDDKNKIEIRRIFNDEPLPYSYVVAISTNTIKDGKSSDWMWCDEAWRTNAKEFRRGILPFLSTDGDLLVSGITTSDTENLMYNIHFEDKRSIPFISDCFATYNFLMEDFPKRAKALRNMAEEEFDVSGMDSDESQTNYRLSWDVLEDGRFYSYEKMKKNKNFAFLPSLIELKDPNRVHRVAGLDLATINDYCVLSIFDVYKTDRIFIDERGNKAFKPTWNYQLREIITYNMDRKPMSAEDIAEKVAKHCNTFEIDMLLVDGTTSQRTHNEWIYKKIRELNINTLICPYDFSGDKNKVLLMNNFEQNLKSGLVKFGSESELKTHQSFKILYTEIIKLFKGFEKGKRNMQWKAKGKGNTDDHVMSVALACNCIPYISDLIYKNKFIEINSYSFRPKLNKFSETIKKEKKEMPRTYMTIL